MNEKRPAKRRNTLTVTADLKASKKEATAAKVVITKINQTIQKRKDRIKVLEKRIKSMRGNIYLVQKANLIKAKKIVQLNSRIQYLKRGYFTTEDIREKVNELYNSKIKVFKADSLTSCALFDVNFYKAVFVSEKYTPNELFLLFLLNKHGWMVPKDAVKLGISEAVFKRVLTKFIKSDLAFVHQMDDIKIKTYTITKKGEDLVKNYESRFKKLQSKI